MGGKKINGRNRHIVVDKLGLLLAVAVTVASADDGTIAPRVLGELTAEHRSRLKMLWGGFEVPEQDAPALAGGHGCGLCGGGRESSVG
ncbi:transposase [Singulisphaera rosea]